MKTGLLIKYWKNTLKLTYKYIKFVNLLTLEQHKITNEQQQINIRQQEYEITKNTNKNMAKQRVEENSKNTISTTQK